MTKLLNLLPKSAIANCKMKFIQEYFLCLLDRKMMSTAIQVALLVGSGEP